MLQLFIPKNDIFSKDKPREKIFHVIPTVSYYNYFIKKMIFSKYKTREKICHVILRVSCYNYLYRKILVFFESVILKFIPNKLYIYF